MIKEIIFLNPVNFAAEQMMHKTTRILFRNLLKFTNLEKYTEMHEIIPAIYQYLVNLCCGNGRVLNRNIRLENNSFILSMCAIRILLTYDKSVQ